MWQAMQSSVRAMRFLMTRQARRAVLDQRLPAMRIVACEARQLRVALAKAAALLESIRMMVDLEAILRIDVERRRVVGEQLAGAEGIDVAAEAAHAEERDRGLQVALVADVHHPPRVELRRIHDRRLRLRHVARERDRRVARARPVAALAADALRQLARKRLRAPIRLIRLRHIGIGVVAEHALVPHAARHAVVIGTVIAGRHAPRANLRIPGDRQLIQLAAGRRVEIGARTMARAEDPVDHLLEHVDRLLVRVELIAAKHDRVAAAAHFEILLRLRVKVRRRVEVFDQVRRARPRERLRHADVAIRRRELAMAVRAQTVIDIPGRQM